MVFLSKEEREILVALGNDEQVTNSNVLRRLRELGLVRGLEIVGTLGNEKAVITGLDTELTSEGKKVLKDLN